MSKFELKKDLNYFHLVGVHDELCNEKDVLKSVENTQCRAYIVGSYVSRTFQGQTLRTGFEEKEKHKCYCHNNWFYTKICLNTCNMGVLCIVLNVAAFE